MGHQRVHSSPSAAWQLAAKQHGVVTRAQLLGLGFSPDAIKHRVNRGRLHPVQRGVYALGRPELTQHGRWMAAVLSCGAGSLLSHESAGALFGIRSWEGGEIEVSIPAGRRCRRPGLRVHRRVGFVASDVTTHCQIPVTSPVRTLMDLAVRLRTSQLETAVNEADKLGLVDPETLRSVLESMTGQPGVAPLRSVLDRRTFALTDSELERRFLPLVRRARLPLPWTRARVNGFRVDFYWPDLGLVVETDGLRYHRTPAAQAADRRRDQAHAAAGLTPLRFTHAQVRYEPREVVATLAAVAARLQSTNERFGGP